MMRNWLKRLRGGVDVLLGRKSAISLDAFSSSQTASKLWLTEQLEECLQHWKATPEQGYRIWILGGWYGLTNLLIRARGVIPVEHIRSLDIDPECQPIADRVNKFWEWQEWQFKAQTCDVNKLDYSVDTPHIVINTSVEHIESDQWYKNIPSNTLVVLQANDQTHDDHVWCCKSPADLLERFGVTECLYQGTIEFKYPTGNWNRHMIIARK